jgi:iron(III) transport system ATP-binding protein
VRAAPPVRIECAIDQLAAVNPSTPAPLLGLRNVTHRYATQAVVSGLSFALVPGTIGCLLGSSGCGKTTVLRCIAGFEPVATGEIVLDGSVVSRPGLTVPPERRGVGMAFQDAALFPHLTVAENIGFGLRRAGSTERRARVEGLLDAIGLAGYGARYPHELSGGQQQRVALARALAPRPRVLLLDEPFSNLDADLRERLAADVRSLLKSQGTTAILVTHDQHEAFAMADEIGVLGEGRIQQWDSPWNLYHRPANRFVADFVGRGAFLDGTVTPEGAIRTELGLLDRGAGQSLAAGASVAVLLRPDDVVHDAASPVRAEVVSRAFRGGEILYTLRLASGVEVLSLVPSHHDHAQGERIGIRLDAPQVIAFPRG